MNAEPNPQRHEDLRGSDSPMFSLEAERALLSSCLIAGADVLARCRNAGVTWKSFFAQPHGVIYAALQKLFEKHSVADPVLLAEFLQERGKLELVGGHAGIAELINIVATSAHAPALIERVLGLWHRRRAQELLLGALEEVRQQQAWEDVQGELATTATQLAGLRLDLAEPIAEVAVGAREQLGEMMKGTAPRPDRIITGLREFDERCLPFDPINEDFLVLLMAPPSHGKSSLARNITAANLARNKRFVVFLLETGRKRFLQALACELARVNMQRLEDLPRDLAAKVDQMAEMVAAWCAKGLLFVFDDVYSIDEIEARTQLVAETSGPIDCVVVDYVQQVRTRKRCHNREQEVADISSRLVKLGKKLWCVVLGLAQMNREAVKEKRLPRLTDLRESGALGQDAGRVVGIHRPEKDCRGQEQKDNQLTFEQWLCQIKFRNGPTGYVKTWFKKSITRFENMRKVDADTGEEAEE